MTGEQATVPAWRLASRMVLIRGQERTMRLVAFDRGWIASVDTESGPTLAADRSPYLAAWRALEPLGADLAEAMVAVADVRR